MHFNYSYGYEMPLDLIAPFHASVGLATTTLFQAAMRAVICLALVTPLVRVNGLEVHSILPTDQSPLLSVPTYALAIPGPSDTTNMCIVTYASPISIRPDRIWTLGIYKPTHTSELLLEQTSKKHENRKTCVILQFLTEDHIPLLSCLGGTSGRLVDKSQVCQSLGCSWVDLPTSNDEQFLPKVLPNCAHYLKLEPMDEPLDGGSHWIYQMRVVKMWQTQPAGTERKPELLMTTPRTRSHYCTGTDRGSASRTKLVATEQK